MNETEIIAGLEEAVRRIRDNDLLIDTAPIDAAIDRLRREEYPKVYKSRNDDVTVFTEEGIRGTVYFSHSDQCAKASSEHTCIGFGDEILVGPARAEALERIRTSSWREL
jgi:hypothetical protein